MSYQSAYRKLMLGTSALAVLSVIAYWSSMQPPDFSGETAQKDRRSRGIASLQEAIHLDPVRLSDQTSLYLIYPRSPKEGEYFDVKILPGTSLPSESMEVLRNGLAVAWLKSSTKSFDIAAAREYLSRNWRRLRISQSGIR